MTDVLVTGDLTVQGNLNANGSGSASLTRIKVTLDQSDIQNMFATPVTLIPAQGANTLIQVISMDFSYHYGSSQFAGAGTNDDVYVFYSGYNVGTSSTKLASFTDGNLKQARDYFSFQDALIARGGGVSGGGTINANTASDVINKAIQITNETGAFTGGTGGTMDVYITYAVLDL